MLALLFDGVIQNIQQRLVIVRHCIVKPANLNTVTSAAVSETATDPRALRINKLSGKLINPAAKEHFAGSDWPELTLTPPYSSHRQ
ncbi:hypothetical protein HVA01_03590 [Halovibrio variabilis]|uniref:Uncharacterized protein n=1 Tax=Halovibrio variabilis TaxID=31910 RepID=A0A511UML9_9GAMM|nr:hypothetical protein HVA01_03590 [Halovibrio variabilis]